MTKHVRTFQDTTADASPLLVPHPSTTQLEALISTGAALKGRLDVFEHNPREGVVVVAAGRGAGTRLDGGGAGMLDEWIDSGGRAKVSFSSGCFETTPITFVCGTRVALLLFFLH